MINNNRSTRQDRHEIILKYKKLFAFLARGDKMKKALITGITGPRNASQRGRQDGSYLTELLLQKGYEVHGIIRFPHYKKLSVLRVLFASKL